MSKCVLCESDITDENDSKEHLIPNALGGRRKVVGFVCNECNSTTGESWDAELAKQLLPLSLMFDISRERGDSPRLKVVTTAGEQLTVGPAGKLAPTNPIVDKRAGIAGGFQYHVKARSMDEARRILTGLKRKHPEIDVEARLAGAEIEESYARGAVEHDLTIGGPLAGRSMVKSCLAMAYVSGIDWAACASAVRYLRDGDAPASFGYYNETELVSNRTAGVPLHCLAVRADPESGLILAYAEYFGLHRIVACLGEGYVGPLVESSYALDPRRGLEVDVQVNLAFLRSDIADIYAYKRVSPSSFERAANAVIGPALKSHLDAEQQRVFSRAVKEAFETCGAKPGEKLTEEHVLRLSRTVAEKVAPFFLHRLRSVK